MKKVRIFAIIAAILTAVSVYMFLTKINKPNEVAMTSVIVAKNTINSNTEITKDMLAKVEFPSQAVHINAAQNAEEILGKVSNGQIVENEQIIKTKLTEPGESLDNLAYAIEDGQRAFTLAVDEVSGVEGLLQPGNYVDILLILTIDAPSENKLSNEVNRRTYSTELMQNIKLLAVGQDLNERDLSSDNTTYRTVTVSVSPEQAVKLNLAANSGKIRLTLRSPMESKTIKTENIYVEELIK